MNKLTALCAAALLAMLVSPVQAETVNCDSEGKDLQKAIDNSAGDSSLFMGNGGVDVRCSQGGVLNFFTEPQLPPGGTVIDGGSCFIEGAIF